MVNLLVKEQSEVVSVFDSLWEIAAEQLSSGRCSVDSVLASNLPDTRQGVTLRARFPQSLLDRTQELRHEMAIIFPKQFLVAEDSLHLTLLSMEPVREGFQLLPQDASKLVEIVSSARPIVDGFAVSYSGLGASPGALFLQGIPADLRLNELRDHIRTRCRASGVARLMDSRYLLKAAHSTMLRFVDPVVTAAQWEWLKDKRTFALGEHRFSEVELVLSDWYHTPANVRVLWHDSLGGA